MGPGVDLPGEEDDGPIFASERAPALDVAHENLAELVHRQGRDGIRGMNDHDDSIEGDDRFMNDRSGLFGLLDFLLLEIPGRLGDVAGAVQDGGDARPRAASGDGHVDFGMELVVRLGPSLAEVDHGVRAFDLEGGRSA